MATTFPIAEYASFAKAMTFAVAEFTLCAKATAREASLRLKQQRYGGKKT